MEETFSQFLDRAAKHFNSAVDFYHKKILDEGIPLEEVHRELTRIQKNVLRAIDREAKHQIGDADISEQRESLEKEFEERFADPFVSSPKEVRIESRERFSEAVSKFGAHISDLLKDSGQPEKMATGGEVEDDPTKTTEPGEKDKIPAKLEPGEVVVSKEQLASLRSILTTHDPGLSPGSIAGMPDESLGDITGSPELVPSANPLGDIQAEPEISLADIADNSVGSRTELRTDTMLRPPAQPTQMVQSPLAQQFPEIEGTERSAATNPLTLEQQEKGLELARELNSQGLPPPWEVLPIVGQRYSDAEIERMSTEKIIEKWRELSRENEVREREAAERTTLARSQNIPDFEQAGTQSNRPPIAPQPESTLAEDLGYTLNVEPDEEPIAPEPPVGTMLPGDVDDEGNIIPPSGDSEDWSIPVSEEAETSTGATAEQTSAASMGVDQTSLPPAAQASSQTASAQGLGQSRTISDKARQGGRIRKSPAWGKLGGAIGASAGGAISHALGVPHWMNALGESAIGHLLGGETNELGGLLGGDTGLAESNNTAELVSAIRELTEEVRKLSEKLDRSPSEEAGIQPDGTFIPKGFGGESHSRSPSQSVRPNTDGSEESRRMMQLAMETVTRLASS